MKDEKVLIIEVDQLNSHFDMSMESWQCTAQDINALPFSFKERRLAETDFLHKQVIPYILVYNHKGEILHYRRHGNETRLSGISSAGIGGHINEHDRGNTLYDRILYGLKREISEEIGINIRSEQLELVGMINEDRTEVGLCHIGVVFKCVLESSQMNFESEIANPEWDYSQDLNLETFEIWSALAIDLTHKL